MNEPNNRWMNGRRQMRPQRVTAQCLGCRCWSRPSHAPAGAQPRTAAAGAGAQGRGRRALHPVGWCLHAARRLCAAGPAFVRRWAPLHPKKNAGRRAWLRPARDIHRSTGTCLPLARSSVCACSYRSSSRCAPRRVSSSACVPYTSPAARRTPCGSGGWLLCPAAGGVRVCLGTTFVAQPGGGRGGGAALAVRCRPLAGTSGPPPPHLGAAPPSRAAPQPWPP